MPGTVLAVQPYGLLPLCVPPGRTADSTNHLRPIGVALNSDFPVVLWPSAFRVQWQKQMQWAELP
jgi:hypothetical protein